MTHDQIVDEVRQGAGIDVDDAATRVSRWLNHLIRELAAESAWIKGTPELGPTVADQAAYNVPANVARILEVRVGGSVYERESLRVLWDIADTSVSISDEHGLFAETFADDGSTKQILLAPTPSQAGTTVEAIAVLYPAEISGDQSPPFPDEFHFPLVHGCVGYGLSFGDESNAEAEYHLNIYREAKERLRRLANMRMTSRNLRAKVAGFHYN